MNIVAILANGVGSRFESNIPKQFHKINGRMVIDYVVDSVMESTTTNKIIIATNISDNSAYLAEISKNSIIDIIDGGKTRNQTLMNVLDYINLKFSCSNLIVCDAVRPMITGNLIDKYFEYLKHYDAVVTAQKITDSLGSYDLHEVNRDRYYLMQSPEGFNFSLLYDNFDANSNLTEVSQQLPHKSSVKLYFEFQNNFKLTYPADLKYLEALIKERDNDIDFRAILLSVNRLNSFIEKYYPNEIKKWLSILRKNVPELLLKWQIDHYEVIKSSHFGIVFLAHSIKYGKCVIKLIPPFINRYKQERNCYQLLSTGFMCELFDYDDSCSALLLERCENADNTAYKTSKPIVDFFIKVKSCSGFSNDIVINDYKKILSHKIHENEFNYKNGEIMSLVESAITVFDESFDNSDCRLIHGDLHRYNIMQKNGELIAIDPIGYFAPIEFEIARFIGTELTDNENKLKDKQFKSLVKCFSSVVNRERLVKSCFVDFVFRLHNSIFENDDYSLTDKWLCVINSVGDFVEYR